jgi:YaiO family outer membrane protein
MSRTLNWILTSALLFVLMPAARAGDILADARALSSGGHRPDALRMLERYLQDSPDDPDARVLYALMLSWDGRSGDARKQFEIVLAKRPGYGDAVAGLINVELWSDHPERAEQLAAQAIERKGPSAALLFAESKALRAQNRDGEALEVLHRLLSIDPQNQAAIDAERTVRESLNQWRVGYTTTYDRFSGGNGSWMQHDMKLSRSTPIGTMAATYSRAERFGLHSNFNEITFYPHIRRGTYGYLGAGFSRDGTLFAKYRLGAEIFQSLPHGMEASVGYRKFGFSSWTNMYTGSAGKYLGSWLITGRFYFMPDQLGVTKTVSVSARRFLHHYGDYFEIRAGTGPSPFDPRSRLELQTLNAFSGYVQFHKTLSVHWVAELLAGAALEDRLHRVAMQHYVFQSSMYCRF